MASGTRTRDWLTFDYYAVLGIDSTADSDAVTRAFRDLAKRSHPDATDDAEAAARFSDVAAAYGVLADRDTRRAYDQVRAEFRERTPTQGAAPTVMTPPPRARKKRKPWSARKALTVMIVGVVLAVLGVGAGLLTWSMHEHDARQRARFVPVTATRVNVGGAPFVSFVTRDGTSVQVPEPQQHGDPSALGPTVGIRYDPADPSHVITDSGTIGRDITFTIIALKLMIGGSIFAVLGWRRLRSATSAR